MLHLHFLCIFNLGDIILFQEFLCDPKFSDEEDLEEKLAAFKGENWRLSLSFQPVCSEQITFLCVWILPA